MLLDSNIIIYATLPENAFLVDLLAQESLAISVVTQIETLGYHRLSKAEKAHLTELLDNLTIYNLSPPVVNRAIHLRQIRPIGVADAVIAATALIHNRVLISRNLADFDWIVGLPLLDPFRER